MRRATISLLLALLPIAAAAQQVRGVVRDSVSGVPIVAAVVTTEGSTPAVRTLTDGDGRFTLDLPATVTRLRVLRIGFSPRVVEVPGDAQARGALVVR
ncbi:MAG TPA: carboxypeptidase regulatory-like domain-containing protein, partial [Gemmatimonadaceae bacterium]|nr:carboxypeptidase regulatory-like domain-containing protein [Gemmatimonadaceae bacterium]